MFFKKKATAPEEPFSTEPGKLYSIANGKVIAIEDVKDEVFADKILGDGVGVYSDDGVVYAPCDGTVGMVADSCHAVGVTAEDGTDVLIHIGINTVAEHGKGFTMAVKQGDTVHAGDRLLTFDKKYLSGKGYDLVIPVIISDAGSYSSIEKCAPGKCKRGDAIITYKK